jgi:hypothetical protein
MFCYLRHPDDIDIFAGGISETPVEGGVIGPLFSCIVGQQFYNLKYGDRFYYENADERTGFNNGLFQKHLFTAATLIKFRGFPPSFVVFRQTPSSCVLKFMDLNF